MRTHIYPIPRKKYMILSNFGTIHTGLEPMNFQLCLYNMALHLAGLPLLLFLQGKSREEKNFWKARLGLGKRNLHKDASLNLWFHAASVGEVTGAIPTLLGVRKRFPEARIFLSVATPQGFRFAQTQLPPSVTVIPFPLDFPWVLQKTLEEIKPALYVGLEGEFWPNLLHTLQNKNVPAVLLNGRLSQRSARRYARFRQLLRPLASHFSTLAMLTEEDRQNLLKLGIPNRSTRVLGSSKHDALTQRVDWTRVPFWKGLLNLEQSSPVVVGGSLRRLECIHLLEVFESLKKESPQAVGIFAPRHMKEIAPMSRWLEERHIPHHLLSDLQKGLTHRSRSIVLVDQIGILFELYGTGDLIFCGGTLEPIGGHNILEPAAWSKAVFYGPHLQKVQDEHNMLHSLKGSFVVTDPEDLLRVWRHWSQDLAGLQEHGHKARKALEKLAGVTDRHLEIIEAALKKTSGMRAQ